MTIKTTSEWQLQYRQHKISFSEILPLRAFDSAEAESPYSAGEEGRRMNPEY